MTIEMSKKYRTRAGHTVRLLCTDVNNIYSIIGAVKAPGESKEHYSAWMSEGKCYSGRESADDLIEVSPYEDWPIDVAVWSKTFADSFWIPRHFAGIHAETGKPLVWRDGYTGHTCRAADPHFAVLEARLASEFDPDEE